MVLKQFVTHMKNKSTSITVSHHVKFSASQIIAYAYFKHNFNSWVFPVIKIICKPKTNNGAKFILEHHKYYCWILKFFPSLSSIYYNKYNEYF